jgi:hypothetical protein
VFSQVRDGRSANQQIIADISERIDQALSLPCSCAGSLPCSSQFDRIDLGGFGDSIADSSAIISPAQKISSP